MFEQIVNDQDMLTTFHIIEQLAEQGVKIVDWDERDVEIQFANGDKERMTRTYAAVRLAEMVNGW